MHRKFLLCSMLIALTAAASSDAHAGRAIALDPTLTWRSTGELPPEVEYLRSRGWTVDVVSQAAWNSAIDAGFPGYDLAVMGDHWCQNAPTVAGPGHPGLGDAVDGKVIVLGVAPGSRSINHPYDPESGARLMGRALDFAMSDSGSGRTSGYFSLNCYYQKKIGATRVEFLSGLGDFWVIGWYGLGLQKFATIVGGHPALDALTDADLSWYNNALEMFPRGGWPRDFEVFAMAVPPAGTALNELAAHTGPYGTRGYPYIVARGIVPHACGDGVLNPSEECDDGNNVGGDGCGATCRQENCPDEDSDGICDPHDVCLGLDFSGDGDEDGVCTNLDGCDTVESTDVDASGVYALNDANACTITQLCPCDTPWPSPGAFIACNAEEGFGFKKSGLWTGAQFGEWMRRVSESSTCGTTPEP